MNYKNNKKGFTLIELLAVIVILAVIALIATPIIMGVINDARKGAAEDSMYSYVKAVELAAAKELKSDSNLLSGTFIVKDGNLISGGKNILSVDLKGTKPGNDIGGITLLNGRVIKVDLKFDGYCIGYDGEKAKNKEDCTVTIPMAYEVGTEIYYNPETNKQCTSAELNTSINAKTGCLKWNVVTLNDTTSNTKMDLMLDHNSTSFVAWNSSNDNSLGMKEAATALQADASTWYSTVKSSVRIISGQELANIGKDTVWKPNIYSRIKYSEHPWIYGNLSSLNTFEEPSAYWTATPFDGNSSSAWWMGYQGIIATGDVRVYMNDICGVRPVITISKDVIK